ncbi:putative Zn-dependent hydrolase of beta-lactamase fold [Rhodobacteraceae bacterium HIMB11]|nr:putative Zn-dependent hydrolase of beta-lactamase fold [Rhodobacteraceae bacterium HIMB11]
MVRKIVIPLIFLTTGCTAPMDYSSSPNFNVEKGQFEHPEGDKSDKSIFDLFGMATKFLRRENDEWEDKGFPVISSSKAALVDFSENMIWVGQSTILLNHNNLTVLTDPHFGERASPFSFLGPKRLTPPPFTVSDLPKIDIVLVSHNHYDHLDKETIVELSKLQPNIKYFVPLGLESTLKKWGAQNVVELDWWQSFEYGNVEIQATPVQHWSKRSFFDRNNTLWAGWMMKWDEFSFYFAGDSGYSNDFKETANKLGSPTLAAIPIGAYEPREFMKGAHMDPAEAVKVFSDLDAKYAVGIHWGTFKLTLEPMNEPPRLLKENLERGDHSLQRFRALRHGEIWNAPFAD